MMPLRVDKNLIFPTEAAGSLVLLEDLRWNRNLMLYVLVYVDIHLIACFCLCPMLNVFIITVFSYVCVYMWLFLHFYALCSTTLPIPLTAPTTLLKHDDATMGSNLQRLFTFLILLCKCE